jgi:hypothetical protein
LEDRIMWVPPPWLIHAALHGAAHSATRSAPPPARGQTTKVVRCEQCEGRYAYELKRVGRDAEHLRHLLTTGTEAIPCPACGWYQSAMIPKARGLHRRWMVNVGACLTLGLIPVAVCGGLLTGFQEPILVAGLLCVFAVGIGMLIWRHHLARNFNPNDEDVGARTLYGQSRAVLLSEQGGKDVLAHAGVPDR